MYIEANRMRSINITELRNHLPHYLSTVQRGNKILVTTHGKVIARIVPPVDTKSEALKQLKILRKKCKVGDVVSPIDDEWDATK